MDPGSLAELEGTLATFLGRPVTDQAREALKMVAEFVQSTTRGEGFPAGVPSTDLAAVIVTAAARLASSPAQLTRREIGGIALLYNPFTSFTVAERLVLHRYRKRTA